LIQLYLSICHVLLSRWHDGTKPQFYCACVTFRALTSNGTTCSSFVGSRKRECRYSLPVSRPWQTCTLLQSYQHSVPIIQMLNCYTCQVSSAQCVVVNTDDGVSTVIQLNSTENSCNKEYYNMKGIIFFDMTPCGSSKKNRNVGFYY
jgi:hypothetical protein